jgi:hypothetical protein
MPEVRMMLKQSTQTILIVAIQLGCPCRKNTIAKMGDPEESMVVREGEEYMGVHIVLKIARNRLTPTKRHASRQCRKGTLAVKEIFLGKTALFAGIIEGSGGSVAYAILFFTGWHMCVVRLAC